MENKLLAKMFDMKLWEEALDKAVDKGIDKGILRKMCEPNIRLQLYNAIENETMEFMPSHMCLIPKDTPGEFRTVFVGEPVDRCLQSIINDSLFALFPEMIHPSCRSYQKGVSTGQTVKKLSGIITNMKSKSDIIGVKVDFHHYFDDINRESIMKVFDTIEQKLGFAKGAEPVMNLLRKTWNNDFVFDLDGNLIEQYCGIRQGNAVGSFLANVIMYELDEFMSKKYKFYCRYSDDCVVIHDNPSEVLEDMNRIIAKYGVHLNPKKVEMLYKNRFFTFLGFNICGPHITFSKKSIKNLQNEIEARTIKAKCSTKKAIRNVVKYLYEGYIVDDKQFGWAAYFLPTVNVREDINELNLFVMDCIRAVDSGKKKVGGIGENKELKYKVVSRGTGKNVRANRDKWHAKYGTDSIDGYLTLVAMQNALKAGKPVYEALLSSVMR